MTIKNKLFKAVTQNLQPNEVKEAKKHLNQLLANFTGNPLSESKLDVLFSKFAGAENPNTLAAELEANSKTVNDVATFLSENLSTVFSDIGFNFHISENEDISFLVPLIRFQVKHLENNLKRTFEAVVDVQSARTEDRLTIVHSLAIYDIDEDEYIELPEGWDLTMNDITFIIEEYLEFGEVKSKSITDTALKLFAMKYDNSFNELNVLLDASGAIATHVSIILKEISGTVPEMISINTTQEFNVNADSVHAYQLVL